MSFGGQSRGLIIASKTQGWDPTKIPARDGKQEVDLAITNHDPGMNPNRRSYVGALPSVTDSFPESITPVPEPYVPFNAPDAGRENANRRTTSANPYPGGIIGSPVGAPIVRHSIDAGLSGGESGGGDSTDMAAADPSGETP